MRRHLNGDQNEHREEAAILVEKGKEWLHRGGKAYHHAGCGEFVRNAVTAYAVAREAAREIDYDPVMGGNQLHRSIWQLKKRATTMLDRAYDACVVHGRPRR